MKRDQQVFYWTARFNPEDGKYLELEVRGRPGTAFAGKRLTFPIADYAPAFRERVLGAGHKAVFQQRTSQCVTDEERFQYWQDLHKMFRAGVWERETAARGAPVVAAWIEVLADVKLVSVGKLQAYLSTMDKAERERIRERVEAKYAARIAARKDERGVTRDLDLDSI
jgi:hypothetical protein